jgi:hypothetical protein
MNEFDQFDSQANSFNQFDQSAPPTTGQQPASKLSRFATGLADPVYGVAQLADQLVDPVRQYISPGAASMGDVIRQREAEYQAPEGVDWMRLAGNVANPVTVVGPGKVTALKQVATRLAPVAAAQSALAPTVADNPADFWQQKGQQAAVGAVAGPAAHYLPAAVRATGRGVANLSGLASGAGGDAVQGAFRAGQQGGQVAEQFTANMRGQVPASDVVDLARQGVANMRQGMHDSYKANRAVWSAGQQQLDYMPVLNAYQNVLNSMKHGGEFKIGQAEQNTLNQIGEVVYDWQRMPPTTEMMDALKQRIQAIYPDSPAHKQAQRAVTSMTDAIRSEITRQNPAYADAMKDYWLRSSQLDEIERSLSLGDRATVDTALRKLQSLMRNNANTNYGQRLESAQALADQGGVDVMPALAGQALNTWTPRGIQRGIAGGAGTIGVAGGLVNIPQAAGALALQSPRLSGEVAYYAGKTKGKADKVLPPDALANALRYFTPAAARSANTREKK